MALIVFSGTASTWSPSVNPRYGGGYSVGKDRLQPKRFSDGGDVYCYSHGELDRRVLEWPFLPATDMTNLLTFMDSINTGFHTFELNDYDAATYTARIINHEAFSFRHQDVAYYEVVITLEVE